MFKVVNNFPLHRCLRSFFFQQKHVIQYKTNTHPDKPMHTSLCFDLWTPTSASLCTHCLRTRGQNRKKMPTFSSHYTTNTAWVHTQLCKLQKGSPRFLCRLTAFIKLNGYSNFINAIKRQRNLGLTKRVHSTRSHK
jgi:hypothetical protein